MNLDALVHFLLSWSRMTIELTVIFHRPGVSLRAGPLQTMCPFWCLCPVMLIHPSSRPPQAAPSGCPRRTWCSGTSSHSPLVSIKICPKFPSLYYAYVLVIAMARCIMFLGFLFICSPLSCERDVSQAPLLELFERL